MKLWRIATISFLCGATALVVIGYAFTRPFVDFGVYFTAAKLFLSHGNPYSLVDVFAYQNGLGFHRPIPLMFLCPPWVLTMVAPLGFFHSYVIAWLCWFAIVTTSLAIASRLLMDIYFGDLEIPEISQPRSYRFLFCFTFYPALLALKFTQLSPLVILGVACCLHFNRKHKPILAGLFLSLTLLKPHLVLLFWLALLLDREWKILTTCAAMACALTAISLARFPHGITEYRALMAGPYITLTVSGMFAGLRAMFPDHNTYWLQWVPPAIGVCWMLVYWWKRRDKWNLTDRLPAIITASILAAPYGYLHDQTMLMVPIIYLAASAGRIFGRIPFRLVAIYTALNIATLGVLFFAVHWAVVVAPPVIALILRSRNYLLQGSEGRSGFEQSQAQANAEIARPYQLVN
jgi:hypothetical protein